VPLKFAPQTPEPRLFSQTQQSPQTQFDGLALGLQAGSAKRVPHEPVINDNIRPHDVYPNDQLYTLPAREAIAALKGISFAVANVTGLLAALPNQG
jgi:hypothetical protein